MVCKCEQCRNTPNKNKPVGRTRSTVKRRVINMPMKCHEPYPQLKRVGELQQEAFVITREGHLSTDVGTQFPLVAGGGKAPQGRQSAGAVKRCIQEE